MSFKVGEITAKKRRGVGSGAVRCGAALQFLNFIENGFSG